MRESGTRAGRLCLSVWYDFTFSHILVPVNRKGDYYLVHEGHAFKHLTDLLNFYQVCVCA